MEEKEFGAEKFINENCWLVANLGRQIYGRCKYCRLRWRDCYYGPKFLLPSLLIPLIFFSIVLLMGIRIERNLWGLMIIAYLSVFGIYSYLFNKSADEVIEAGFKIGISETEIGSLKVQLEKKLEETNAELYNKNKELQENQKRFEQIAENAGEWIWEVDADGLYTYASPVVEKILGYKPQEIVGKKHFYDLFAPDVKEELKKTALEVFEKKGTFRHFVNPNIHKKGSLAYLETNGVPILDKEGNLLGYRGVDTDIAERKQAEKAIQKAEQRHREIIENIFKFVPDSLLVFTDKLNLFKTNKAFQEIVQKYSIKLNYTEQELAERIIAKVKKRIIDKDYTEIKIPQKQA